MEHAELTHNPRVIAGTLTGFEGFRRFLSPVVDPLRHFLPVAVEVDAVPEQVREFFCSTLRARGFFIDDREVATGRLRVAGSLDQFDLLDRSDVPDSPAGFHILAHIVARAVSNRFVEQFEIPCRRTLLSCSYRPLIMGILNLTPDSFSDGGRYADPERAIDRAMAMVAEGADLIDVGAESSRPGAGTVSAALEMERLEPVLRVLVVQLKVPISVDTMKSEVADRCLGMGVDLINDVSGLEHDPRMGEAVARHEGVLVINHMQGSPGTMQDAPRYDDAMADICRVLRERLARARHAGVAAERIILDPGIGFGKRLGDNLDLLARVQELRSLGRPVLVGCSRKSFLGELTGREVGDREAATAATTALATLRGVKLIRVHDVRQSVDVLKILDAINDRFRME